MTLPCQQTIAQPVEVEGIGFFTGQDVSVRFRPASPNTGIQFLRVDHSGATPIPAHISQLQSAFRRTQLGQSPAEVQLVEHVLAALAGLEIDNCLVELSGPELPGLDGSAKAFTEVLNSAGHVVQSEPARILSINQVIEQKFDDGLSLLAEPAIDFRIRYELDYGKESVIESQVAEWAITPQTFSQQIASARTFVTHSEVEMLKKAGIGTRNTAEDLLVFGKDGKPIDNQLRMPNECACHKLLDCIGDFALAGMRIRGHITARKTGHRHNHAFVQTLLKQHSLNETSTLRRIA